ncbi:efflux RND transporter periplasmic adaptor subunit [Limnohabitans sp. DM1]|uniref:efflux RND transporter periplasmic adaptor subunit n=1 Tax=Limnohabitans sp. DM1 TaxID=1597955 RepID=UPI000B01264A|nr:efflux RND transporter periplasmic adaptor subunit [Limnohabitans sp. DM1]
MKNLSPALQHMMLSLLIGSSAVMLSACNKSAPAPAATQKSADQDPTEVSIRAEMGAQFKVSPIEEIEITPLLDIAGRIEANERLVTRIGASVTGRVTEVLSDLGEKVRPGQPLARVASHELTTMQMNYLRAHSAASQAERAVDRAKQLIQADVIGSAELQRRESEQSVARAELRAAHDQLRQVGLDAQAIDKLRENGILHPATAVTASIAGVVIERKVSQGQVAQPGDPLFTVADLSNVWVAGALPEQVARSVQTGQSVTIEVPALGQKMLSGKIIFVGDTVSPDTRTVAIRTQVDNAQRELKPQMLATMRIRGEPYKSPAIPAQAVVRENDRDHVFVRTGDLRFRLTPVELGTLSDGMRPVIKGLSAGAQVVTEGAFHMNNERKRAELE